jgi:hypothetical protein
VGVDLSLTMSIMRKGVLIQSCEELIKKFDPKKMTLDSHADQELGDCESSSADPGSVFVKQVFYGCVRNKQSLKVNKISIPATTLHKG